MRENFLKEFWDYRGLIYNFFLRDFRVFYKNTLFGFGWAIIQPLSIFAVFYLVFAKITKFNFDGAVPYSLILLSGVMVVQFVSSCLGGAQGAILGNLGLFHKIYFPKYVPTLSRCLYFFTEFFVIFFTFMAICFYKGFYSYHMLFLPLVLLLMFIVVVFISFSISILSGMFKDFKFLLEFAIRFLFFLSPVPYTYKIIPEQYLNFLTLNPLFGIIHMVRWSIFGEKYGELNMVLVSSVFVWVVVSFLMSYVLIRKYGDEVMNA